MKCRIGSDREFKPVNLTITFESEEELLHFKEIVRYCDSIPDMIVNNAIGVCNFDGELGRQILMSIYDEVHERFPQDIDD